MPAETIRSGRHGISEAFKEKDQWMLWNIHTSTECWPSWCINPLKMEMQEETR